VVYALSAFLISSIFLNIIPFLNMGVAMSIYVLNALIFYYKFCISSYPSLRSLSSSASSSSISTITPLSLLSFTYVLTLFRKRSSYPSSASKRHCHKIQNHCHYLQYLSMTNARKYRRRLKSSIGSIIQNDSSN
jgi:hypothetical protein